MSETQNSKHYDLENRTLKFAKNVIELVNKVSKTLPNLEISKQLIRSAGSVGANYIEANESLSPSIHKFGYEFIYSGLSAE